MGNTTIPIVAIHFIVNLKNEASLLRCSLSPIRIPSFEKDKNANSWALNCKIILLNPKSAKIERAERLVKRYQYPCCVSVRNNGISSIMIGPLTKRHI